MAEQNNTFGTIEYFSNLLRKTSPNSGYVADNALFGIIASIIEYEYSTPAMKVKYVHKVLAAANQVRAELDSHAKPTRPEGGNDGNRQRRGR